MAGYYPRLLAKATSAGDKDDSVGILAGILADRSGKDFILDLDREEGEPCIEILDYGLAKHKLSSSQRDTFITTLWELAAAHERLPSSVTIKDEIELLPEVLQSGGFSDVQAGKCKGSKVAVKTLKVDEPDVWLRKRFCRMVVVWSKLSHPNILQFFGVRGDIRTGQFSTVSEWMERGDILRYIEYNPANRFELLHGAAQGLKYLHDQNIVHADLNGTNILVTYGEPPSACLADFDHMTTIADSDQPMLYADARIPKEFLPPECFDPNMFGLEYWVPTREGDIYAFGMTIFQVLTGETPFRDMRRPEFANGLLSGLRPAKPPNAFDLGFSESLWDFLMLCWDKDSNQRPVADKVVKLLGEAAANRKTPMPPRVLTTESGPPDIGPGSMKPPGIPPLTKLSPGRSQGNTGEQTERLTVAVTSESNDSSLVGDQPRGVSVTPSAESRAYLHNPSDVPLLETQRGDEEHIPDPCVDAPADPPIYTAGRRVATLHVQETDRIAPPSRLEQLGNAFRATFAAVRGVVPHDRAQSGRQPVESDHNVVEAGGGDPPSPVLRCSCCCCKFSCC